MKISIITCTFNRSNKLIKTLESVMNQNYKNYEHFIIDDGSNDDTEIKIDNYKSKKINYIKLQKNYGQPEALLRSNVFNLIKGDLVILLDSDDILCNGFFELTVKDFLKYKDKEVMKIGYNWTDNIIELNKAIKKIYDYDIISSNNIFYDKYPLNANDNGYRDYLFVSTKKYWKLRMKYFISPNHWYVSQYDVAIKDGFNEIFTSTIVYYMSLDLDTVTRGNNFYKYSPITNFTREYLFENYKNNMSIKYFNYAFFSMIFNLSIFPKNKFKILNKLFSKNLIKLRRLDKFIFTLFILFIPSSILLKFKYFLKTNRRKR